MSEVVGCVNTTLSPLKNNRQHMSHEENVFKCEELHRCFNIRVKSYGEGLSEGANTSLLL